MTARPFLVAAGSVLAVILFLWPAIYNGQPFFFSDTTAYARGADMAVWKATGITTPWTLTGQAAPDLHAEAPAGGVADKAVLAGRSVYYGALVYLGARGTGEWLTIVIQAALLFAALAATLKTLDVPRWPQLPVLVIGIAVFTAAPLYASFLMPDVFTGLTLLGCGVLLTHDLSRRRGLWLFWFVLVTMALTFHTTHALLALLLLLVGAAVFLWRRSWIAAKGLGTIGAALLIAYLCGAAFTIGVTKITGEPPLTPPFLMARLIDDGPGYRYLKDTCPQNGFLVCRFMDRLPLQSDIFLWSKNPQSGVFGVAPPDVRRALSREQYRFALAVAFHEPVAQVTVSLDNAMLQAVELAATEFSYSAEDKETFANKVPAAYFETMQNTPAYRNSIPAVYLSVLSYGSTALGLIGLVMVLIVGRRHGPAAAPGAAVLAGLVVFGVIANAAVCGIMSGPHDRYEARVAWLIPAIALITHFQFYRGWWARTSARGSGPAV